MSMAQRLAALAMDAARNIGNRRRSAIAPIAPRFVAEGLEKRVLLAAAPVFFHPQTTLPVGTDPQSVAVGDMNNDHIPDLVVANFADDTVSIMLGNGDGTFGSQKTFPTGDHPNGIVVADFNEDGNLDVATANRDGNDASILLGDGKGSLAAPTDLTAGTGPRDLAVGDFNNDHIPDLAVANFGSNNVSIFLGNGDGSFVTKATTGTLAEPISVAVGDFDNDGKLDVVTADFGSNGITIDPGNGDGTFGIGSVTNTASPAAGVAVADINGDGKADLVLADYSADSVSVLIGNGNTTFHPPTVITIGTGSEPAHVAIADVNGDGKLDIITDTALGAVGTLLGDGAGNFAAIQTETTGAFPGGMAVADVNGDGAPDIIAPNFDDATVSVLLNDPAPALVSIDRTTPPDASTQATDVTFTATFTEPVSGVSASDFSVVLDSGMTSSDMVVLPTTGPSSTYTIEVEGLTGNGNVSVTMSRLLSIVNDVGEGLKGFINFTAKPVVGPDTNDIVVADINRDGKPDVIVADALFNEISVDIGQGSGVLTDHVDYTTGANSKPAAIAVADVNGDGLLDIVSANTGTDTVGVFLGVGDGTVHTQVTYPLDSGDQPDDIALADVNGDGKPDIIVSNYGSNTVGILLNHGNGTFGSEETLAAGSHPVSVAVGDFRGNGVPDLAVANLNESISYFQHIGPFTGILLGPPFMPQVTFQTGGTPQSIIAADVNGDNKLDLVVDEGSEAQIAFLAGNGAGSFAAPVISEADNGLKFMSIGDMNGDNIPDVAGSDNKGELAVMLGNGDGTYQHEQSFDEALFFTTTALADMNGDGKLDVISAGERVQANQEFFSVGVTINAFNGNTFTSDAYTILKRDATLNVTGADALFDGNPHGGTVTATGANGEDLTSLAALTYTNTADNTVSTTPPTQPGTYEIFASFAGNDDDNAIASFDTGKQLILSPLSPLQSIPTGSLPTAKLIAGQKIKPIHFNVKVSNTGATAVAEAVTVDVVLSSVPSGTPNNSDLGHITKTVKIAAHKTVGFGAIIIRTMPAGLSGTFSVLFKLADANGAANLASAGTISVGPESNDLAAVSNVPAARVRAGKKLADAVIVTQNGNVPFAGALQAEVFLSTVSTLDGTAIDLGPAAGHISIQPGKHATLHLSQTIPTTVAAGSYFVIIKLLPSTTPADSNSTNDIVTSVKQVTVS